MGQLLWAKNLVSGLNGNISMREGEDSLLITATKTCLGFLKEEDIVLSKIKDDGEGSKATSTEKLIHASIYNHFPDIKAVIHTHSPYINGYFLEKSKFISRILESKIALGEVQSVEQLTPSVTDIAPVLAMMKKSNIGVLANHGVLSMGSDLFDCFLFIQTLEEAIKIESISRLYRNSSERSLSSAKNEKIAEPTIADVPEIKYKLFSDEQINAIVSIVNSDAKMQELGTNTQMTMDLAVKLEETGQTYSFNFENGKIVNVGNDQDVEFLITANEKIWRAVFSREIDPFVATTQKKMHLKGDFAKISKWYAPCSRIFELWTKVPIE